MRQLRTISRHALLALIGFSFWPGSASGQETAVDVPVAGPHVPQQPYQQYFTEDRLGRRITFYLSEEPATAPTLPLVVYVHGSGSQSHFVKSGDRVEGRNGHSSLADVVRGHARLIIVEKPGVEYLDAPADAGGASDASATFRREHTLERWSEAVQAAIRAARRLPVIHPGAILVVGHSEGGIVAAKVAADNERVTHVAVLAGGGPTQLYSLIALARDGTFFGTVSDDPTERVAHVLRHWALIRADPESPDRMFFGHPYRRWSSFLTTSTLEQLRRTGARIFVAQGTADRAVAWGAFEVLRAELLAGGSDAEFEVVEGGDHSFAVASAGHVDAWAPTLQRVIAWFLAP